MNLFYQWHIMIILNGLGEVLDSENFLDHNLLNSLAVYPVYLYKRQNSPCQKKEKERKTQRKIWPGDQNWPGDHLNPATTPSKKNKITEGQLSDNGYNLLLLVSLIPTEGVVCTSTELRA